MALRLRKNHLAMSAAEKRRFVEAVLALKRSGEYDRLVKEHRSAMPSMSGSMGGMPMHMAHMAHRNPWFLPWHREFLGRYEAALRKVDPKVTLPYWNWLEDRAKSSPLWHSDFMGGTGRGPEDHVADGPFAYDGGKWRITVESEGVHDPALRRTIGRSERLPTKRAAKAALASVPYDTAPWDDGMPPKERSGFRPQLEYNVHNPVHGWVGGTMELATSPNDPVFFLHHANVDRLWAVWRHEHPGETPYLPTQAGTRFDQDQSMPVFDTKPEAVLDHHALGYRYDVEDRP
jgi:tyrosinase